MYWTVTPIERIRCPFWTRRLFAVLVVCLVPLLAAPTARAQGLFEEALGGAEEEPPAQEGDAASEPAPSSGLQFKLGKASFDLNGYLRGVLYLGKVPDEDDGEVKAGYGEMALKLKASYADYGDAVGEFRLRYGYFPGGLDLQVDLREVYINAYIGPLDIRVGHQVIVWGQADGTVPTDNVTPRDLSVRSPTDDDRRVANFGVRAMLNFDPYRLEMVYLPFHAPAKFPDFGFPDVLKFLEPDYPDSSISNSSFGARLHLSLPAIDASISYLYGFGPYPGIKLATDNVVKDFLNTQALNLQFAAYRHHVVGLDFGIPVASYFVLRGEAAYKQPEDFLGSEYIPNIEVQYALGVDRAFGDLFIVLQYSGRYVLDWEEVEDSGLIKGREPPSMSQILALVSSGRIDQVVFDELVLKNRAINGQLAQVIHSVSGRVSYTLLQNTLSLEVMGMYNFSTEEWMCFPKAVYKITNSLLVSVGAELYGGPDNTLFGLTDEILTAGYLELKASY